jgi:hypothetical protein
MAALIEAQGQEAMPAIVADIDQAAAGYRDEGGLGIPIAAFVAYGRKSGAAAIAGAALDP